MAEYEYTNHPTKLKKSGKRQSLLKHRKIWMENYGEIPKDKIIHHINGNKKDNKIENLQMLSRREHSLEYWQRRKTIKNGI